MQMLFVHGSGGSHVVWHHQLRHFDGADAVDLPGHPTGDPLHSVEECAAWLEAYVDERGYRDMVLVGHSLGGAIALQYALDRPDQLAAIVTVGSGARLRVAPETLRGLERAGAHPKWFRQMIQAAWQQVEPELGQKLIESSEAIGPAVFLTDLEACDRFDVIARLGEIHTPTFALCGSDDVMTPPKYSEFLAARIEGASSQVIAGGTHMVFVEKPQEVNAAIGSFVARVAKNAVAAD